MKVVRNNEELLAQEGVDAPSRFPRFKNLFIKDIEFSLVQSVFDSCIFDNCNIGADCDVIFNGDTIIRDSTLRPTSTSIDQYISGDRNGAVKLFRCSLENRTRMHYNDDQDSSFMVRKKSIFSECSISSIVFDNRNTYKFDSVLLSCDIDNLFIRRSPTYEMPYFNKCTIKNATIKSSGVTITSKGLSRLRQLLSCCEDGIEFQYNVVTGSHVLDIDFGKSNFIEGVFSRCTISGCDFSKLNLDKCSGGNFISFIDCIIRDDNNFGDQLILKEPFGHVHETQNLVRRDGSQ